MEGLILCGGSGTRVGLTYNKCLLSFRDKPLLYYNVKNLQKYCNKINIIVGYDSENVISTMYKYFDNLHFIYQDVNSVIGALYKGLSVLNSDSFILSFGDEFFVDYDLHNMIKLYTDNNIFGVIGVSFLNDDNINDIKKTFSVEFKDNCLRGVVEKPDVLINNIQGTGCGVFNKKFLKYIENNNHYPDILQKSINNSEKIFISSFCNKYFNINTMDDYKSLKQLEEVYNE